MQGARKYAELFNTGQIGRLYITSGSHARGTTFHIQVLPEGVKANRNGGPNMCTNDGAVEVYGVTGGQPGWTERYGWLHEGKWQEDCQILVGKAIFDKEAKEKVASKMSKQIAETEDERVTNLLAGY